MRILIGCEEWGNVRQAFRRKGHEAYSCDLSPAFDNSPFHIQDDIAKHLNGWDMIIAFPPCTYLTIARNAHYYDPAIKVEDERKRKEAIEFVKMIWNTSAPLIAIENPVGVLSTRWRKPTQIIHPHYFGDPYTKRTCLWLKGLPKLINTNWVPPVKGSWHYYGTDPRFRARTFPGIAAAMAEQWPG